MSQPTPNEPITTRESHYTTPDGRKYTVRQTFDHLFDSFGGVEPYVVRTIPVDREIVGDLSEQEAADIATMLGWQPATETSSPQAQLYAARRAAA